MSRTGRPRPDVIVVGSGPSGCTAARLLASWGYSVRMVTKGTPTPAALAESLPPSCRSPLRAAGLLECVDAADFQKTFGNTAWWGDTERIETFPEGAHGYQVEKDALERILRAEAERAGAEVITEANVQHVDLPRNPGGRSTVRFVQSGSTHAEQARWILDASGRFGVLPKQLGLRRHESEGATLALIAAWECPTGWDLSHPTHTLVESFVDGWGWSVPLSPTLRHFTLMVDPRVSELDKSDDLTATYRAQLLKSARLHAIAQRGTMTQGPYACSASLYTSSRFGGNGFLLLGDAASFIDPLSSFGVKKALASGWLAAVVAHTCLTNPSMESAAMQLHAAREHLAYAGFRAMGGAFAEQADRVHEHPFWQKRAAAPDPLTALDGMSVTMDPDIVALRADPDVLAAFQSLREAPAINLRILPAVQVHERPTVRDNLIVLDERLSVPGLESELRFLRGVDLLGLARMADRFDQVPDLYEAYCRAHEPVVLPDFLGALSVMLGKGLLGDGTST